MIDPEHPVIQQLAKLGYRIAGHCYLHNGKLKYTYAAKHSRTGEVVQGWSAGGDADDALNDLAERAGLVRR